MSCQIGIWFSKKIELLPVRQFNEPNDDFLMEQITQRKKGLHLPNWMLNIKPCWTKWNLVVQWLRYLELNWVDASKTRGPGFETWHPHFECRTGCFTSSFSKMGHPRPLFIYFGHSQTNITFFTTNIPMCQSRIGCCDLSSQPSAHEAPPITTRPGLPAFNIKICWTKWNLVGQLWFEVWNPTSPFWM